MTIAETRGTRTGLRVGAWRPVQYLGSKLRSLGAIAEAVDSVCDSTGTVWDAFTGSSVVAQAIAAMGRRVIANDTQHAAATFARALLGVGREDDARPAVSIIDDIWDRLRDVEEAPKPSETFWESWLKAEDEAITSGDARRLVEISEAIPQRWKGNPPEQVMRSRGPDFASTFAGTYFGLRQALRIDALRSALERLEEEGSLSLWERDLVLTGLCHAASEAVFSAGKHFAQPLRAANGNLAFAHNRLLRDRSVNIGTLTRDGMTQAAIAARAGHEDHRAVQRDALEINSSHLVAEGVQCVYADPPYTAQQYSRFYHVLETLVKGAAEPLQVWRGGITRGLYPRDRYMSPFCSVTDAPGAFESFIATVAESDAALVLSYSASRSESSNARIVRLEELQSWLSNAYGHANVEVLQLDHTYRQFNSADLAAADRDEPEYLLVAGRR